MARTPQPDQPAADDLEDLNRRIAEEAAAATTAEARAKASSGDRSDTPKS